MKRIAVIVVNYRTPDLAIACINALDEARAAYPDLRVVVVDGASDDGSVERIAASIAIDGQSDWVTLLPLPVNGGFAFANNRALRLLTEDGDPPDAIALINPDARVRPGALKAMAALLDREAGAGAVGARLEHEDGRPQGSAFTFPSVRGEFCRGIRTNFVERLLGEPPVQINVETACEVPWVTGAAVMFRTKALQSVGFFDEGFFLYFEETELMRRLHRGGWSVWHEPTARVVHQGGAATRIRNPETGLELPKRLPRYWYESRRRYFALTGGGSYAVAAGFAWLAGHVLWQAKRLLSGRRDDGPQRSFADLVAYGWWPRASDRTGAVMRAGAPVEAEPAWMKAAK